MYISLSRPLSPFIPHKPIKLIHCPLYSKTLASNHRQVSDVETALHAVGTVYERLGSDSHVTAPLLATLMYLYWKVVPGGRLTVVCHRWFELVYCEALSAMALPGAQEPRAAMLPTL